MGASIGSFLNVVAYRMPLGRSVVHPGSACPSCEKPIAWYDNLPVLSWFVLRGKCRNCQAGFSIRYAAIEAFFGLLTVAAVMRWDLSVQAFSVVLVSALLLTIGLIDHDSWLIDDRMSVGVAICGLLGHFFSLYIDAGLAVAAAALSTATHLGAGLLAFSMLWGIGWIMGKALDKEALGGGDAPLFAAIICATGFAGLLPVLMLASLQGLIGWALLAKSGGIGNREVQHDDGWEPESGSLPLGIFLALAGIEVLLIGEGLTDAYLEMIRGLL
jgi:leader peptidase (prepilin peptidase)/N-methyltransferase